MDTRIRRPIALLVLTAHLGCSSNPGMIDPPTEGSEPSFPEDTAAPGQPLRLEGLVPTLDLDQIVVEIDGEEAFVATDLQGNILVVVPWNIDPQTLEIITPTEPVDVVIRRGNDILHELPAALTITAPPAAPGTCEQVLEDLQTFHTALPAILAALPTPNIELRRELDTTAPILDWFLDPDNPESVVARVGTLSAAETALLDRVWSSTGLARQSADFAALSQQLVSELGTAGKGPTELQDAELAVLMQFAVVYEAYGNYFIKGMAEWFSLGNTASGIGVGLLSLFKKVPQIGLPLASINLGLALRDFIINKHLVGLFPRKIDSISLELLSDVVYVGRLSETRKHITASNIPPNVTLNDFIAQLLNVAGVVVPADYTAAEELILTLISSLVEAINNVMTAFSDAHPDIEEPNTIYSVPDLRWTAELVAAELIDFEVVPEQAALVGVEDGVSEWIAASGQNGDATVWIQPSRDPEAIALELGAIDYDGAAFGVDIVASPQRVLKVRMPLSTEIETASSIAEGGINALSVLVFREESLGKEVAAPGAFVQLQAIGGALANGSGTTDASGQFVTTVSPSPGSTSIEISATVSDTWNEAEEEMSIPVIPVGGRVVLSDVRFSPPGGGLVECSAFAGNGTEYCSDPPLGEVKPPIDADLGVHQTWSCSVSDPTPEPGAAAQSTGEVALDIDLLRDESGRISLIDWVTSSSISGSTTSCIPGPGGAADARVRYTVQFSVTVQEQATVRVVGVLRGGVSVEFSSGGGTTQVHHFSATPEDPNVDDIAVMTPGPWTIRLHENQRAGGNCPEPFTETFSSNLRLSFD